jgi:hypothetical protein
MESNHNSHVRSVVYYPLYYSDKIWWTVKESNLTAATLHINGNGFTVRRREYDPKHTHDQEALVHKQTMSAHKECVY